MTIRVSDHALVRFVARSGFAELEALRERLEVSLSRAATTATAIGQSDYSILADGLEYRVVDGVVVTIIKRTGAAG